LTDHFRLVSFVGQTQEKREDKRKKPRAEVDRWMLYVGRRVLQAVYDRMFTSVVQCINEAIEIKRTSVVTTGRQTVIGVLDIYGFEIFDNNRYKQTNKQTNARFTASFPRQPELGFVSLGPFHSA